MNVPTITMPRSEAKAAFLKYREAVKARHDSEDLAIMRGYRALARGRTILNLRQVLQATGLDERGLPKLAIGRANWTECWLNLWMSGSCRYADAQWPSRGRRHQITFGEGYFPAPQRHTTARAIVPLIPPQYRPKHSLGNYHILWEAEWQRRAPVDPLLLKHIHGDLYAVLAAWDLTPVEQAVLGGRL